MRELTFATGLTEMQVNGGRVIRFNPADVGFMDTLFTLLGKIEAIEAETEKKRDKTDDLARLFDYARASDKRMREAVDAVFGEGFCDEVFPGLRLTALADGLTVLENFVFAVVDQMDESIRDNLSKRNDRIAKYTAKYRSSRHDQPVE